VLDIDTLLVDTFGTIIKPHMEPIPRQHPRFRFTKASETIVIETAEQSGKSAFEMGNTGEPSENSSVE
jgi:hypothetical protein